jgi:hypothetical protein
MPLNLMGIKHWSLLHWYAFVFVVGFIAALIGVIFGFEFPGPVWLKGFVFFAHGLMVFYSLFFIEWPGRDGFKREIE